MLLLLLLFKSKVAKQLNTADALCFCRVTWLPFLTTLPTQISKMKTTPLICQFTYGLRARERKTSAKSSKAISWTQRQVGSSLRANDKNNFLILWKYNQNFSHVVGNRVRRKRKRTAEKTGSSLFPEVKLSRRRFDSGG